MLCASPPAPSLPYPLPPTLFPPLPLALPLSFFPTILFNLPVICKINVFIDLCVFLVRIWKTEGKKCYNKKEERIHYLYLHNGTQTQCENTQTQCAVCFFGARGYVDATSPSLLQLSPHSHFFIYKLYQPIIYFFLLSFPDWASIPSE